VGFFKYIADVKNNVMVILGLMPNG